MFPDSAAFSPVHRTIFGNLGRTHLGSVQRSAGVGQHLPACYIIDCEL